MYKMNVFPFDLNGRPLSVPIIIHDLLEKMFEEEKKRGIMVKVFGEIDGHHFRIQELMFNMATLSKEYLEERIEMFQTEFPNDYISFLDPDFELTPYGNH